MPLGLKIAPSTFLRAMTVVLSRMKWWFTFVHSDDIVILSKSVSGHFRHRRSSLVILSGAHMSLKMKKCFLLDCKIDHLDHVTKARRLAILDRAASAIHGLKRSTNVTELKSFLYSFTVFQRLVPNLPWIAALLDQTLIKHQSFHFDGFDNRKCESHRLFIQSTSHCCFLPYRDRTDNIHWTQTHGISKLDALCFTNQQTDPGSPLDIGNDLWTMLNGKTTQITFSGFLWYGLTFC